MRVLVTGSTGFVGEALVKELLSHGHQVLGLTRSAKGVSKLKEQGAEALEGTIEDTALLKKAASECDAVAHLAFIRDFANYEACCEIDWAAIEALGAGLIEYNDRASALEDRALVITSGTLFLPQGRLVDEDTPCDEGGPMLTLRGRCEPVCLAFAKKGLRASVVRLPPTTHGPGFSGFSGALVTMALRHGRSAYVGDGQNSWPAVHRDDAARVYRLAIERGGTGTSGSGSVYHTVAEESVVLRDIATEIGKQLGMPVVSVSEGEEVDVYLAPLQFIPLADNKASSVKTRQQLGWSPTGKGVVEDMVNIVSFVKNLPPGAH
ncbi:putative oxidoreductase [Xylariaceae sp. FL0255]|nr:putative oxidoreductase [Xylariaceae sp. FL0255]